MPSFKDSSLAMRACPPGRIVANHFGNQLTKTYRNAGPPWSRLPLPEELEPFAVPADHGFWFAMTERSSNRRSATKIAS
jgi:hypothetical protein